MDADENEMAMRGRGIIPDICQFWYNNAIFRFVKSTSKNAKTCNKIAKIC